MAPDAVPTAHGIPAASPRAVWAALGAIYLIWGSTYLAIRVMVETLPPALGAGARFVTAGALMLAGLSLRRPGGAAAVRVPARQLARCALIGTLLAAGGNGLVTIAESDVPSGLAALIVASVPLWIVVLVALAGQRPDRATRAGIALGFVGVLVLLAPGGRPGHVPLGMALLIVLAAISWALGSFTSQRIELPASGLVSTGWQMLLGGLVLVAAGLAAGETSDLHPARFSTDSVLALAYLVVIGSIVAFSCYAYLLEHAPISQVATYAYVNPVIAVLLGAIILGESIAPLTVVGMVLVVTAVAITVRRRDARAPEGA